MAQDASKIETTIAPSSAGGGTKLDQGKPQWGLLPAWARTTNSLPANIDAWWRRTSVFVPPYTLRDILAKVYPTPCAIWLDVVRVLEHGAKKYGRSNWEKGMQWSRAYDAFCRHWRSIEAGEVIDPEFGLPHEAHALCELVFLAHYELLELGTDDRPESYLAQHAKPNPDNFDVRTFRRVPSDDGIGPKYVEVNCAEVESKLVERRISGYSTGPYDVPRWFDLAISRYAGRPCTERTLCMIRATLICNAPTPCQDWARNVAIWFDGTQLMFDSSPGDKLRSGHNPADYAQSEGPFDPPQARTEKRMHPLPVIKAEAPAPIALEARPYIWGFGGVRLVLDPQTPEELPSLARIATSLAGQQRWTGHASIGRFVWTVAHHSVLVSRLVAARRGSSAEGSPYTRDLVLAALLHDAAETLYGDSSTPVKRTVRNQVKELGQPGVRYVLDERADRFDRLIEERYELPLGKLQRAEIKEADVLAAYLEALYIMCVPAEDVREHFAVHKYGGNMPSDPGLVGKDMLEGIAAMHDPRSLFLAEFDRLFALKGVGRE